MSSLFSAPPPVLPVLVLSLLTAGSCDAGPPADSASADAPPILVSAPGSPYAVGGEPADVAVGDVDGDGHADLVLVGGEGRAMVVLAGDGEGGFAEAWRAALPAGLVPGPHFVALGDVDGDGALDAAVTAHDSNDVVLLRGSGGGAFVPFPSSPVASGLGEPAHNHGLGMADLDGDGDLDLLFGNQDQGVVAVLRNDGRGGFAPAPGSPFPAVARPYPFAVGDLDGDEVPDLVIPDLGGDTVALLRGSGDGSFSPFAASPLGTPPRPFHAATGDLDGDGHLDLIVGHNDSSGTSIHRGAGDGTFRRAADAETGPGSWEVAVADFDGDGHLDLAAGNRDDTVRVLLGAGDGTFRPGPVLPAGDGTWTLTAADLNGDGASDLVSLGATDGTVSVWLQRAD